ncbi:endocuticle structural glycoprotein SgAbd-3-like isoform X2 [Formica exsecta]|uniref:endocuticle structural glycoprotein SgAbd-3-like isoform X2 n=1 Tax=Formica exsecta TaxID=72781 RepID=UPI0011438702|nr:endocuticle structural glycoprotein SgAbd-3-like isoform X2 [Formica exsecta]
MILTLCVLMEAVLIISSSTKTLPVKNDNAYALGYPGMVSKIPDYNIDIGIQDQSIRSSKPLYSYNYNIDTGIQIQESGYLNHIGTDKEALEARGSYGYIDNEGNFFSVLYTANENGFQPEGAHLPTVPPLIIKALQYIAKHPEENGE